MTSTTAEMNNEDHEGIKEEDDEVLEALKLRYQFADHSVGGKVWAALEAAGCTYHKNTRRYAAPLGRSASGEMDSEVNIMFDSSNDLSEFLDQVAIPPLVGNLQSPVLPHHLPDDLREQIERVRHQALTYLHQHDSSNSLGSELTLEVKQANPLQNNNADADADADNQHNIEPISQETRPRKSTRKAASDLNSSVTSVDKGSELYLKRQTKGRASKRAAGSSSKLDDLTTTDASTLSSDDFPKMEECLAFLQSFYATDHLTRREASYRCQFADWRFLLSTNHSLLLFGAGSKYELLQAFAREELDQEGYVLMLDGFDRDFSMDGLLDILVAQFLQGQEPSSSSAIPNLHGDFPCIGISNPWRAPALVERSIAVSRALARQATESLLPIFLLIPSIEGSELHTDSEAQEALAALLVNSRVENGVASVRLVASVDHVDATPALWPPRVSANLGWIWKEVHTLRPYIREMVQMIREKPRRKKTSSAGLSEASAPRGRELEVLAALAPRHAEIVQILAKLQLHRASRNSTWISYQAFRDQCKKQCTVSKDAQLQSYVSELSDHGLLATERKESDIWVTIPFPDHMLQEFLNYKHPYSNT